MCLGTFDTKRDTAKPHIPLLPIFLFLTGQCTDSVVLRYPLSVLKPCKIYLFLNNAFYAAMQHPHSDRVSFQRFSFYKSCIHQTKQLPIAASPHRRISKRIYQRINLLSCLAERAVTVI